MTPVKAKDAALLAPVRLAPVPPLVVSPVRVIVPPMSLSATPVPVVVATEVWATSTPVIAPADVVQAGARAGGERQGSDEGVGVRG